MKAAEVVMRVKAAIDELSDLDYPKLAESDNYENMNMVIVDKIPYALEYVIRNAPASLIDGDLVTSVSSGLDYTITGDNVVEVTLPEDVLRITSARLSSWKVSPPVSDEHSDTAKQQLYPFTCGTYDKPATVLYSENGKQILRLYSAKDTTDKYFIAYARMPDLSKVDVWDGEAEVNIPTRLAGAFIYYIAFLTMVAFDDTRQTAMMQIAQQQLKQEQ